MEPSFLARERLRELRVRDFDLDVRDGLASPSSIKLYFPPSSSVSVLVFSDFLLRLRDLEDRELLSFDLDLDLDRDEDRFDCDREDSGAKLLIFRVFFLPCERRRMARTRRTKTATPTMPANTLIEVVTISLDPKKLDNWDAVEVETSPTLSSSVE